MFHLRPVGAETEDFLFRAYPKDWTVARKPKIGPPKVHKPSRHKPDHEFYRLSKLQRRFSSDPNLR